MVSLLKSKEKVLEQWAKRRTQPRKERRPLETARRTGRMCSRWKRYWT
ncbi:M-phase phosphoprotein 8 isoform X3 [Prionailurus iriomotensis]